MSARVLVIGLDAAESTLIERWTSEGELPAFAELYEQAATYRLDNCWRSLPTAVWPELTAGRSPGRIGLFFPPRQLHTGEAEPRRVEAEEVDPFAFWTIASDAGKRVAAIDMPWTVPPTDLNGIFLSEWGTHDRWFGTAGLPAGLAGELRDRHGDYPIRFCDDDYGYSIPERERLATDLLKAVDHEAGVFVDLLGREHWDLFACAFGQFQCVGHNFWRYLESPDGAPETVRRAVLDVYRRADRAIAALRVTAGPDAVTVAFASHGMGPLVGGPQLLPEVLVRLGAGSGGGVAANIRSRLPLGVRSTIRRLVPNRLRRRLQTAAGSLPAPLETPATRAAAFPADINGYIRLNLRGRDPYGSVEPGAEAEAQLEELRQALFELEHPRSRERIVTEVLTAEEAFGNERHPDVPDLMVTFRDDLGTLDHCMSERVGHVRVPVRIAHRSGDHTGEARLWLAGNGIEPLPAMANAHAVDVAPTILTLLGVTPPSRLEGHSLIEQEARRST
jgi:predicted AlkP superfamily phosphohydrolase/phosphomutase